MVAGKARLDNGAEMKTTSNTNGKAHWLKQRRLERAWSQEQLAEISGLSCRTIQRLEQGVSSPSLESIKALAAAFDIGVAELQFQGQLPQMPAESAAQSLSAEQLPMSNAIRTARNIARFQRHLVIYLLVNSGLFLIDFTTSRDHFWFYYPLIFWGIPLLLQGLRSHGWPWRSKPPTSSQPY